MDQICPKRVFPLKNKKSEQYHWILHIRISLATKFRLQLIILTFWAKFAQKGYFQSKTERMNIHWILHVRIRVGTKFQLKMRILIFLDEICPKRVITLQNKKSEQYHWILHIRISLGTKFRLQLVILTFCANLPKNGISDQKQKKWTSQLNSAYSN